MAVCGRFLGAMPFRHGLPSQQRPEPVSQWDDLDHFCCAELDRRMATLGLGSEVMMKSLVRTLAVAAAALSLLLLSGCMGSEQSAEDTKEKYQQGAKDPAGDGR